MDRKLLIKELHISIERDFVVVDIGMNEGESARAVAVFDDDEMTVTVNASDVTLDDGLKPVVEALIQVAMTHGV